MQNFYQQFAQAVGRVPDRTAIEVQRRDRVDAFSYRRLEEMAARTARWLGGQGVAPGDRCAILAENDAHWCAAYLGALRLGGTAVPLDTAYKASQVATLLLDSGARILFTSPRFLETSLTGREQSGRTDVLVVLLHGESGDLPRFEALIEDASLDEPAMPPCPAGPSDPAVILYTSGTTSDPKGVVLTHANLLAEREGAFAVVDVNERDVVLGVLPLFHALAQMANLLLPFSIGARVVFLETLNTTELLRALAERGITIFACVPQFFYLIHQRVMSEVAKSSAVTRALFRALLAVNRGLRGVGLNAGRVLFARVHRVLGGHMRVLVTGGSKFDPAIGRDLYDLGFNILQAYGLTETSGAATVMRSGDSHVGTVGQALPNSEVRILPPEPGAEQPDGEVLVRGPIVMAGYFNKPEATAAAIRDGWLYTGDLGTLDEQGRLTITGRKKEIIVLSSGKNIYPEEIEAHYRQSPFIKELCMLGLSRPGEPSAERLYAVVVPDPDVLREKKIVNAGDLMRFEIEGRSIGLPAHKRVLGYEVWMEPLPRTSTGKLKRFEIEKRVRQALEHKAAGADAPVSDEDRAWAESEDVAPVLAVIQQAVKSGMRARPDANLELDLGFDSMERVELLTDLELRFGARVPEAEAQRLFTVRELVAAIKAWPAAANAEETAGAWSTLLAGDPAAADPRLTEILQSHPVRMFVLFALLRLVMLAARLGMRIEVRGLRQLPARGPYLISPNHQSYLDSFVLVGVLPFRIVRQLFFVGASEYFATPITAFLARMANVVPVDPDAGLVPAMQAGGFGLRHGKVLVLFPEGERSIDGTVRAFKKGAAILSQHLSAPVVPVAIDGLYDVWPRNRPIAWGALRPWRRTHVVLAFGSPLAAEAPAVAGAPDGSRAAAESSYALNIERVRSAVKRMWLEVHQERTRDERRNIAS